MNLPKNIFLAATAQISKIEIDQRDTSRWMLLTATSASGLSLFSSTLWSIGLMQALALVLILWRCRPGSGHNLAKGFFVVLFAPISIAILIFANAPGIVILPLYCIYGAVIGASLRQRKLVQTTSAGLNPGPSTDEEAAMLRSLRSGRRAGSNLVESGPVIGTFQGCDFVAHFVDEQGRKFVFSGTLQDSDDTLLDEVESFVVPPGLIYRREM